MPIIDNSRSKTFTLPGLVHQTVAGPAHGLNNPGSLGGVPSSPGARRSGGIAHDCEEVFVRF